MSIFRTLIASALSGLFAFGSAGAQTEVKRYDATAESGYGVVYTLPKVQIVVESTIVESQYKPGPLAIYADKYLGQASSDVPTRHYDLLSVRTRVEGIPDTTKRYVVLFEKKSVAPYVMLTSTGILASIQGSEREPVEPRSTLPSYSTPDRAMPSLPREYATAGSVARQAEVAAGYLYELREHLMSILSGDTESMPKDGEAMRLVLAKLQSEEARVLRLFCGDTIRRARVVEHRFTPEMEDVTDSVLYRFSPDWGVVGADDLSGDPVMLSLSITQRAPTLSDKEQRAKDKQDGIVYNLPGEGVVRLSMGQDKLLEERIDLPQVGTTQVLTKKMFNLKEGGATAVYFDIATGAVRTIKQEQ